VRYLFPRLCTTGRRRGLVLYIQTNSFGSRLLVALSCPQSIGQVMSDEEEYEQNVIPMATLLSVKDH
jgi:hypothetical protein